MDTKNKWILVVDDEPLNRLLISKYLQKNGLYTLEASDGLEALKITGQSYFDAVIMDIRMPGMDGIIATRRIKRSYPHLPVIAYTAEPPEYYLESGNPAPFDCILQKPFDRDTFIATLEHYLEQQEKSLMDGMDRLGVKEAK